MITNRVLALSAVVAVAVSNPANGQVVARPQPGQQVVLVTGATSGLGREVAIRLAAGGAHVIVHGRDSARGAEVVKEIEQGGKGSARLYTADFGSNDEIRAFAARILGDYDRLDVLVNNAGFGSFPNERTVAASGAEYRFQVNYLSGFLLTRLLLPRLVASAPSRIVNVSSLAASPLDFDNLMLERDFTGPRAYGQSKLAQVMFTFDLAAELEDKGVKVNALHPATRMPTAMVKRAGYAVQSTIDDGARAVLQLIQSNEIGTGRFYNSLVEARAQEQAYDPAVRARLKTVSEHLVGLRD